MSKPQAVIVYLSRSAEQDVRDLCRSLKLLKKNFLNKFPYPVIVFVEKDFKEEWKRVILKESRVPARFETVDFRVPDFLDPRTIPEWVYHPKFNLGYRHMCRFFSGTIYQEPALKDYRWYWRLDTDAFLLERIRYDVFEYMQKNSLVYGYNIMSKDEETVSRGLWELTQRYLEERKIQPEFLYDFTENGVWDRSYYYTNFEISSLDFWRSEPVRDYFDYVDRSGGIYRHRWGDALVHVLTVAIFLKKDRTHCFPVYYDHQGPHNAPVRKLSPAEKIYTRLRKIRITGPADFMRKIRKVLERLRYVTGPGDFFRKAVRRLKKLAGD